MAEPSDDLMILAIPIFKTISKLRVVFILKTNRSLDFTNDITLLTLAFEEAMHSWDYMT